MDSGWAGTVGNGVVVTVAEIFVVPVADAFVFAVAEAFGVAAVVRTGFVVFFAGEVVSTGAVVCVVPLVGGTVMEFWSGSVGAGAGDDWLVPGAMPEMNPAMTIRRMTAASAMRPGTAKDLQPFFFTGVPFPSAVMAATTGADTGLSR